MPINKVDIKLKQSQRLDDTDYGGGQATSIDVISGEINNLYPDISRLDRTYGRVSLRKAFLQVDTDDRATYYGAHAAITKNATDPNVSVCFFTDNDWFSQRYAAMSRIENYLVQGPQYIAALYGNHYKGGNVIQLHTAPVIESPRIGEVLVLVTDQDTSAEKKQFVRVKELEEEIRAVATSDTQTFNKKILTIKLGAALQYDFEGEEIFQGITGYNSKLKTCIYTTSVADASRYYGISDLTEDAKIGDAQVKVDSIYTRLLPSTQSSTAITDAGIASTISAVLDSSANSGDETKRITKPYAYRIESNGKLHIGTGVKRGSFSWKTNPIIADDGAGNIKRGDITVGSIDYSTGIITFISGVNTSIGTGEISYIPAVAFEQATVSGEIEIEVGNRGYVYTYTCIPIPMKGTLRVDYLAGGKWYTLKDDGRGALVGADPAVGAGQVNFNSGSVAITLGSQPDVGSSIMLYWAQDTRQYDLSGGTYDLEYQFVARNPAIARNTLIISWNGDSQAVVDNGKTELVEAEKVNDVWRAKANGAKVGKVAYATGEIQFKPSANQNAPLASENFWVRYDYGEVKKKVFTDPPRDSVTGRLRLELQDAPINPYTVRIEWHTDLENHGYNLSTTGGLSVNSATQDGARRSVIVQRVDPTHIYYDDGQGGFQNEKTDLSLVNAEDIFNLQNSNPNVDPDDLDVSGITIPSSRFSVVDYANGIIEFMPDRRASYPVPIYKWRDTGARTLQTRTETTTDAFGREVTNTVTEVVAIEEYGFDGIKYRLAPCIFPYGSGRTVEIEYRNTDGSNHDNYYIDLPNTFYIKPSSKMSLIPGSVNIMAGNVHLADVGTGELYYKLDSSTGLGTKCGTINYEDRLVTITEDLVGDNNTPLNVRQIRVLTANGTLGIEPVSFIVFRAPGSPLVPGSLSIRATMGNGSVLQATTDTLGNFHGAGVSGKINYETGVCRVTFGEWVEDIYGALDENDRPGWYAGALKNGTQVWQPYSVQASTVLINCVVTSYLTLESHLLGIDPVRLPIDGKVPIFRDGYIILIHSSKEKILTEVEANKVYDLEATNLSDIAVYDASGLYYPEITGGAHCPQSDKDKVNYTVNLRTGKITFSNSPDFNNYTVAPLDGTNTFTTYKQPFRAKYRVEDMCLAADVQITGHIGLNQPLTHAYKAGETQVSSVLAAGDLQSKAYNEFIQNAWDNVWSDDLRGYGPLANYNFVDFPIQVTNKGAIKERWLLRFTSSNTFDVVGENLGVILSDLPVIPNAETQSAYGGWVSSGGGNYTLTVLNRLTNNAYWTMDSRGFSGGWQSGNCIRFNTDGANMPYWFVRTTLQAPATEVTDDYQFLIRGDSM